MSSSPSVVPAETPESPPADAAEPSAANTSNSSNGSSATASSPPVSSESKQQSSQHGSKGGSNNHRRRFNSQQQSMYPAPLVDPLFHPMMSPNYYPNLYSYGNDFGTDLWNNAAQGFVDPLWASGQLQSPNGDVVFYPQYPPFGFASPDALSVGQAFPYDIPATTLQAPLSQQQSQGPTSPMNGVMTDLQKRLRDLTTSTSDQPDEQQQKEHLQVGRNSQNRSSTSNDESSRSWANVAGARQAWGPASTGRDSNKSYDMSGSGHTQHHDRAQQMPRGGRMNEMGGILPYNPYSAANRPMGPVDDMRGGADLRPLYNTQHVRQSALADDLCNKYGYNPKEYKLNTENARYFIIKSFAEDDVFASVKNSIWCSTIRGNERLDRAFKSQAGSPIYLFYSVNNTGNFCGVAQMLTQVDFQKDANCWSTPRWKGAFDVKWIYIKDIPFREFKEITLENNDGKPVFKSRDTQEVLPAELGVRMLKIFHNYHSQTTLFDDFTYYEQKAAEKEAEQGDLVNGNQFDDRHMQYGRSRIPPVQQ